MFLVNEHGFQRIPIEQPKSAKSPQTVWYLPFGKGDLAVAPAIEVSGPITVFIMRWDGDKTTQWAGMKNIDTLERLRCPMERLSPEQREERTVEGIHNTLAHDATILRKYFPDILDGAFDFLKIGDVESVRKHFDRKPTRDAT